KARLEVLPLLKKLWVAASVGLTVYHLMQMASKPSSTKKIDDAIEIEEEVKAVERSIVDDLLANAFEKGNPDICMRCQCDVRNAARVTDNYSLHAVCIECLAVESHMEFSDADDEAWIPFNDARMYDRKGREITDLVRRMVENESAQMHIKVYKMFDGVNALPPLPKPGEVSEDRLIELRSLLAAI